MPPKRRHRKQTKTPLTLREIANDNIQFRPKTEGKEAEMMVLSSLSTQPPTPVSSPINSPSNRWGSPKDELERFREAMDEWDRNLSETLGSSDDGAVSITQTLEEIKESRAEELNADQHSELASISSCGEMSDLGYLLEDQVLFLTFALDYAFDIVEKLSCTAFLLFFIGIYLVLFLASFTLHLIRVLNPFVEKEYCC